MLKRLLIYFIFFIFSFSLANAQQKSIDSLRAAIKSKADDTSMVTALNALSDKLWRADKYDTALVCANSARTLATKLNFKAGVVKSWRNTGYAYYAEGSYFKSLESFANALNLSEAAKDDAGIALDEASLARVQYIQGNYNIAMDYYLKALAINQKLGDKDAVANNYGNMGNVYFGQLNYDMSIQYDQKAIDIYRASNNLAGIRRNLANISVTYSDEKNYEAALDFERQAMMVSAQMGNKKMIAMSYTNMGDVLRKQGDYEEAIAYYDSSITINKELDSKKNYATNLGDIGYVYQSKHDYQKAIEFEYKSLEIRRHIGDRNGQAHAYNAIGEILTAQHLYDHADDYFDSCIIYSKAVGDKFLVKTSYYNLVRLDSIIGEYKLAFSNYKEYVSYNDSMVNASNTQKTVQAEMNYSFSQQQEAIKDEQNKKDADAEQQRKRQAIILYAFMIGFLLMVALAFFIFRGYKQKQKANEIITKQKDEVEHQRALVEEKNKEILDSITYAKRLQDAILPPMALIKQHLPESFVLYKPKDIVAGDFYWMEVVNAPLNAQEAIVLIAAADCTGHGVPGALVSVVCSNALNRTVKEFKITEPGKILDKVRELVLETFEKSESNVQDGMDISLCCLNTKTGDTQWSGAYNSLWYLSGKQIVEVNADKQPIGKHDKAAPFNTHHLKLEKGDTLYLFTDGYADQFGGPKGKKFKYRTMQDRILEISDKSMNEQQHLLESTIDQWRGDLEQVDDILIIGIRV